MGNFSVIDFDDLPEILLSYGIDLNAKTEEEKERVRLAFESCRTMEDFLIEVRGILNVGR